METIEQFAPELEMYSIDEAFLNLTGFAPERLRDHAATIRRTVRQWTGIPVSGGIGPTKTLAKAANQLAKKNPDANGVWIIGTADERQDSLSRLFIHNSPFERREPYFCNASSFHLPQPTSDSNELIRYASEALTRIFRPGIHYAKCGVMLRM